MSGSIQTAVEGMKKTGYKNEKRNKNVNQTCWLSFNLLLLPSGSFTTNKTKASKQRHNVRFNNLSLSRAAFDRLITG